MLFNIDRFSLPPPSVASLSTPGWETGSSSHRCTTVIESSSSVDVDAFHTGFDMPRFLRPTLIALVIALHAAVTLCGPCLHAMPGFGHGSVLESSAQRHQAVDNA